MSRKKKAIPRNDTQFDSLASIYVIKDKDGSLDKLAYFANNLYNAALYLLRQQLFKRHTFQGYSWLDQQFKIKLRNRENMLYGSMIYRQTAQQTLKDVDNAWHSWLAALKAYKKNPHDFTGRPRIPGYLKKGSRHQFHFTNQNAKIKDGYLVINPRHQAFCFKLKLDPAVKKFQRVTFNPLSKGYFKVTVQYQPAIGEIEYLADNHRYMGIDPGLDNAFTCVINDDVQPLIINGRGVKSVNQFYNKRLAKLSSLHALNHQNYVIKQTKQGPKPSYYYSNAQNELTAWRDRKIYEFSHQATKRILDYALNNDVHTIIIGKNKGQKRSSNMGKRNNQNFVGMPHQKIIDMLKYKANLHGITVIQTNESYTSQTSFIDNEKPCKQNGNYHRKQKGLTPAVRRIHRGLFKTNQGILINADVNGAFQIIRKVFPKVSFANGIVGAVLHPVKWSPSF